MTLTKDQVQKATSKLIKGKPMATSAKEDGSLVVINAIGQKVSFTADQVKEVLKATDK